MTLIKNSDFASVSTSGKDWREICKTILGELDPLLKSKQHSYTVGFLYISDLLQEDAASIVNLFKSVTSIQHWVGCLGIGVCGTEGEYLDEPAISVMLANIDPDLFAIMPVGSLDNLHDNEALMQWIASHDTMLTVLHGDPDAGQEALISLEEIQRKTVGFPVGGMASSRDRHALIANTVEEGGYSGIILDAAVPVATTLSQGCSPVGPTHVITRCEANTIIEIDNQRATEVFTKDLKKLVVDKTGHSPEKVLLEEEAIEQSAGIPENLQKLFHGEVHVAFPVTGSDQRDYVVRNILSSDPDFGYLKVAHMVEPGNRILFVHRDNETIRADLSRVLLAMRKRVTADRGVFAPKGALYVSCLARAFSHYDDQPLDEMKLIREIIGEIPLAGFYANGEIFNSRLYSYTGVLTLFL